MIAPAGDEQEPTTRLARRLDLRDAVVIGLGSMLGAGVFVAIGPAAAAAGSGLLVGLAIAAAVAYCNAASSARLAARYPTSGGTYVYGRERLGHLWGFLAGWGFVVGKTASCAAMALTFGTYVRADLARPLAIGAVIALTGVNLLGVQKTARLTRVIVVLVLVTLAVVIAAATTGGPTTADMGSLMAGGLDGTLEAAGFLFFAFAGYARIATLGEEVREPTRTIPRAIRIAFGIAVVVYAAVAGVALVAVGPTALARSDAPLATVVESSPWSWATPVVSVGAAIASLGVLLSLLVGVSRTTFAMASQHDLPHRLAAVHPTRKVPYRAEIVIGAVVVGVVASIDVRGAIGFSSFAVLVYYLIANASAWTLDGDGRWRTRIVAALGMVGCGALAFSLPINSVIAGMVLLAVGTVVWWSRPRP